MLAQRAKIAEQFEPAVSHAAEIYTQLVAECEVIIRSCRWLCLGHAVLISQATIRLRPMWLSDHHGEL
jgi:hypothetical protein